jgi:hypothetical protein
LSYSLRVKIPLLHREGDGGGGKAPPFTFSFLQILFHENKKIKQKTNFF